MNDKCLWWGKKWARSDSFSELWKYLRICFHLFQAQRFSGHSIQIIHLVANKSVAGVKCKRCFLGGCAWYFGQVCSADAPRQPQPGGCAGKGWALRHPPDGEQGLWAWLRTARVSRGLEKGWLPSHWVRPTPGCVCPGEHHPALLGLLTCSIPVVSYLSVCNAGVCKNKERSKRTFWGEAGGLRVAKKSTCKRQKLMFP